MHETPTALVTGATNGIGAAAAVELAERGWHVLVHGRDSQRGETVVTRARDAGGDATFFGADFSVRSAVRDLAADVREHTDRLDALVLNAGIASDPCRLTWDGVEETFAVNQIAPYLLTHELIDLLTQSAPARIVATSSTVHTRGELDFAGPEGIDCTGDNDTLDRYARSKLANLAFVMELAERIDDVSVNAFHPGFVPGSKLYREVSLPIRVGITAARVIPFLGMSVEDAAEALVYLTDSEDVSDVTGTYFEGTQPTTPDPRVDDPERRDLVWSVSASLAGVDPDWP